MLSDKRALIHHFRLTFTVMLLLLFFSFSRQKKIEKEGFKSSGSVFTLPSRFFFRLYLINSPVVRADSLRFQESGVKDVIKDVFLPWYNAYRFLAQCIELYKKVSYVIPL